LTNDDLQVLDGERVRCPFIPKTSEEWNPTEAGIGKDRGYRDRNVLDECARIPV